MKRLKRLLLGSVGVALLLAGTAVPASAHAQLESTSPAQSSVLLSPTLKCSRRGEDHS
jgi:methionine-rich copper-binding protein CopC